jgi:hypothetical protein
VHHPMLSREGKNGVRVRDRGRDRLLHEEMNGPTRHSASRRGAYASAVQMNTASGWLSPSAPARR